MRTFIVHCRRARTDANFNIEDLPGSGGRMDIVARCVQSALWLSNAVRRDSQIYLVFNGPPEPPKTILFEGNELKRVSPDERSIAIWIKKILLKSASKQREWQTLGNGIYISKMGFQELLKNKQKKQLYVLHEKGENIKKLKLDSDGIFVLGDHIGLPKKEEIFCRRFDAQKISLGREHYLTSQCIFILNWLIDLQ